VAHQLQLTIADWVTEVHDTIIRSRAASTTRTRSRSAARAADFLAAHAQVLGYFERVASEYERKPARRPHLLGRSLSYVDLSMFQMIEACATRFRTPCSGSSRLPRLIALHDRVARGAHRRLPESSRRLKFNGRHLPHYPSSMSDIRHWIALCCCSRYARAMQTPKTR